MVRAIIPVNVPCESSVALVGAIYFSTTVFLLTACASNFLLALSGLFGVFVLGVELFLSCGVPLLGLLWCLVVFL